MSCSDETASRPGLILASASPRRASLLQQLQLPFKQLASPEEEPDAAGSTPVEYVATAARGKARSVYQLLQTQPDTRTEGPEGIIVIGADTVVSLGDSIMGKPVDKADAADMLRTLSGKAHEVHTGVALVCSEGREVVDVCRTLVKMVQLSSSDLSWYVESGEPMDKAGSYGIQGLAARFIERIEGCYYNVVGLPLALLSARLTEVGYDLGATQATPPVQATNSPTS